MHRIFGSNYQNGKEYGQKCDEVKCIHLLSITKYPTLKSKMGKGIKLLYGFNGASTNLSLP
jgi:hypothetical protein